MKGIQILFLFLGSFWVWGKGGGPEGVLNKKKEQKKKKMPPQKSILHPNQ